MEYRTLVLDTNPTHGDTISIRNKCYEVPAMPSLYHTVLELVELFRFGGVVCTWRRNGGVYEVIISHGNASESPTSALSGIVE